MRIIEWIRFRILLILGVVRMGVDLASGESYSGLVLFETESMAGTPSDLPDHVNCRSNIYRAANAMRQFGEALESRLPPIDDPKAEAGDVIAADWSQL